MNINKLFDLPLGMSHLSGASEAHWVMAAAGLAASIGSSLFGGAKSSAAAKKAQREQQYRSNAEKAWYEKAYNTDYLDTKAGQNLLRRAQEVSDSYIRRADGAAAVGGGTAASTALAKESANKSIGDAIATIGARDTSRKQEVEDAHMQNVQSQSREREALENERSAQITNAAQNASNAMMSVAAYDLASGAKGTTNSLGTTSSTSTTTADTPVTAGGTGATEAWADKVVKQRLGVY